MKGQLMFSLVMLAISSFWPEDADAADRKKELILECSDGVLDDCPRHCRVQGGTDCRSMCNSGWARKQAEKVCEEKWKRDNTKP